VETNMNTEPTRRAFIVTGSTFVAVAASGSAGLGQAPSDPSVAAPTTRPAKPPPLDYQLVRTFVGAGHGDLDKTRSMLEQQPGLLNSTWDWGGGDFESAIGGAGHMGRRDIAQFLIDRGARFDLFVAAMMGRIDIVRAMIDAFPAARKSLGPHGISLMAHARKGGAEAVEVVKYLESLG
jgi:hypothetical protein